jgi:hypothetical protein
VAALPEERRLLVAGKARDRQGEAQVLGLRITHDSRRWHDGGEHLARDPEQRQQLLVPGAPSQIVEQRPRCVGVVAGVNPPAGEPRHQPALHGAGGQLAPLGPAAEGRIAQQPFELGGGEVRVGDQAGPLPEQRLEPGVAELAAAGAGAAILPDDRGGRRHQGAAVPEHHRLALVGDAQGDRPLPARAHRLSHRLEGDAEDLVRVMLDPAGLGIVLGELAVAAAEDPAILVHHQRGRSGGALIEREDRRHASR